jgi:hypothetical protein
MPNATRMYELLPATLHVCMQANRLVQRFGYLRVVVYLKSWHRDHLVQRKPAQHMSGL